MHNQPKRMPTGNDDALGEKTEDALIIFKKKNNYITFYIFVFVFWEDQNNTSSLS